jgi:hypothetical protein
MNDSSNRNAPVLVWWILWGATLGGLAAFYTFLKPAEVSDSSAGLRFIPLAPFLAAVVVRWVVLPRFRQRVRAFPIFVAGIALSEACALMGIFLAPDQRTLYFILATIGLLQYVPIVAAGLED